MHDMRCTAVELIHEAVQAGARKFKACDELDISVRTYQRWLENGQVKADRRPEAQRSTPSHALTQEESQEVLGLLTNGEYSSMPPSQVVPRLADTGVYLCSESTMYRILHAENS